VRRRCGRMARRAVVGIVLLVGLLLGLAYQPDVGTAADLNSANLTDHVVGRNHAKPLPRVVRVTDVVRATVSALLVLVMLVQLGWVSFVRSERHDHRHRSVFRSPAGARRGPPALVFG
jgi:hypothetical protein